MSLRRTSLLAVFTTAGAALAFASAASAATVQVSNGTVVFNARPGERNDVRAGSLAVHNGMSLTVVDAGAPLTAGPGCQSLDANSAWCPEEQFQQRPLMVSTGDRSDQVVVDDSDSRIVTVHFGKGDDSGHVGNSVGNAAELNGGPGDDDLSTFTNAGGPPVLRGGGGNDVLTIAENGGGQAHGGDGDDRLVFAAFSLHDTPLLDGGDGNDTYTFSQQFFSDAMVPGRGFDTLDEGSAIFLGPLDFDMSACSGCVERVVGTPVADRIIGDGGDQIILGGDGDDELVGGGGHDAISGQGGNDTINSHDGRIDAVRCGAGADAVSADRIDIVSSDCESVERALRF